MLASGSKLLEDVSPIMNERRCALRSRRVSASAKIFYAPVHLLCVRVHPRGQFSPQPACQPFPHLQQQQQAWVVTVLLVKSSTLSWGTLPRRSGSSTTSSVSGASVARRACARHVSTWLAPSALAHAYLACCRYTLAALSQLSGCCEQAVYVLSIV